MNQILLFVFIVFVIPQGFGQEIFHSMQIEKIKETNSGSLMIVTGIDDPQLEKHLTAPVHSAYKGIVSYGKTGILKWVYPVDDRQILDVRTKGNLIYMVLADWNNSKTISSATLLERIITDKGAFVSERKISSVSSMRPNARIYGMYDEKDQLWFWSEWSGNSAVFHGDTLKGKGQDNFSMRLQDQSGKIIQSLELGDDQLRLRAKAVCEGHTGFVFQYKTKRPKDGFADDEGVFYLGFTDKGKLESNEILAKGAVTIDGLQLSSSGILLGGTFSKECIFKGKPLYTSPLPLYPDYYAYNGFLAHVSYSGQLKWLEPIESKESIMITSLSAQGDSSILCLKYRSSLQIGGKEFVAIPDPSEYSYSNAAICFFDSKGKIRSVEQVKYGLYTKIKVFLTLDHLIWHGEFLYVTDFLKYHLEDQSKNETHYLIFQKR